MRGLPLLILLGICTVAWSATVYKWTDDNGVVHFSDQPNPKAEKIQVQGAQTYGAQAAAVAPPPPSASQSTAPPAGPAVCVIDTPAGGQVYLDANSVSGHVTVANGGQGAQPSLRLDGQDISSILSSNGSFAVDNLPRGEHTLTLQVSNAKGEMTCEARPVTFSIRQRSSAAAGVPTAPAAPAAPRAPGVGSH